MHDETKDLQGLRTYTPDRRDYDDWANNDEFCHGLLLHKSANATPVVIGHWNRAIQSYWRERKSRRELATELNLSIDAVKSLLRTIRRAADEFRKSGPNQPKTNAPANKNFYGRCHTTITANEMLELADGKPEMVAYAEEYRRLTVVNQLGLFDKKIASELVETLERSYELGHTNCEHTVAQLIAHADELKNRVAKEDAFEGRPVVQTLAIREPNYHCDRRGRPRKRINAPNLIRKRERPREHGTFVPDVINIHAGLFFNTSGLNRISDATETKQGIEMYATDLMDYKQAAEIIKEFNIPRSVVARLAELHLPDLSAWLGGKVDISQAKQERVSIWVADVAKMIRAMATLQIKVDLTDVENVRTLVQRINDAEMQMSLPLADDSEPLRTAAN